LVSGDGSVPYRTSIAVVESYDGPSVAAALELDFALNGPPLVVRLDRARCHKTDDVLTVARSWGVLLLHGPPRHPGYYGQLERQNREHRGWLDARHPPTPEALAAAVEPMRRALNGLWRRPTLGWRTAEQLWNERSPLIEDRSKMREETRERAQRILLRCEDR